MAEEAKKDMEKSLQDRIAGLVTPAVLDSDCELLDVEILPRAGGLILRLIIDKEGGVGIDDCVAVSERVEPILDKEDPIDTGYDLEVSSPGVDRPLKTEDDLRRNLGRLLEVKLHHHIPVGSGKREVKRNIMEGILIGYTEDAVTLELDEPFIKGVRPRTNGLKLDILKENIHSLKQAVRF